MALFSSVRVWGARRCLASSRGALQPALLSRGPGGRHTLLQSSALLSLAALVAACGSTEGDGGGESDTEARDELIGSGGAQMSSSGETGGASSDVKGSGGATTGAGGGNGSGGAAAQFVSCADGNPCTLDNFTGTACEHTFVPDGSACDDGDLCSLGDTCEAGVCTPGEQSTSGFGELGRLSSYGTGRGVVVGTGDGQFLFSDPLYRANAFTVSRIDPSGSTVEGQYWETESDPYLGVLELGALITGWEGHAVVSTSLFRGEMLLVAVNEEGEPASRARLKLPESPAPFVSSSQLNGLTSHNGSVWACGNLSFFFGAPQGTIYRFDVSDPEAPVIAESFPLNTTCGSVAVTPNGSRVYVNTTDGIRWFDPSAPAPVTLEGPFGANSGLLAAGDRLLSRTTSTVTFYSLDDHTELAHLDQEGLRGVAYAKEDDLLVVLSSTKAAGDLYERRLALYDADPGEELTLLDEVVLGFEVTLSGAVPLAVSGSTVVDPVTKAAFDFSDRELSLLVTKGIGDLTGLERAGGELVGWGTYSRLVAEVEDPELPDWQAGGPVLGNLLALSGSFAGSGGALVATPTMSPQGSRFPLSVSPPTLGGELVLAQRNSSAGDLESWVTLQGASKGSLQWAGDSLYHFVYGSEQGGTLSRWERAQFGQQELSVSPSWTLEVAGPTDVRGKSYRESFVIAPDESWAFVAMMTTDLEGTPARNAVWLDLTQEPPVVLAEAVLADGDTWFQNCIATKDQAACTGVDTYFYERVGEDGDQVVATTGQDNFDVPVVPFAMSGGWIYLASADGLRRVPFGFSLADFAAAPLISMSFDPTAMAATSNAWAVASRNELVLFSPECAEQPEPTGLGGASGAD